MGETKVRTPIIIALLVTMVGGLFFVVYMVARDRRQERASATASVTKAREERIAPLIDVAPAPLRAGLPFTAGEGKLPDGYPVVGPDGAQLRSLLWHEKYDELDRAFDHFQTEFEHDDKKEYWPTDAALAFESAEGKLGEKLDRWVAARPKSFGARLARGTHWVGVGWALRGTKWAKDTPPQDFAAMQAAFPKAAADFDTALILRPRAVAAMIGRLRVLTADSRHAEMRAEVDRATKICPGCVQIRAAYLMNTRPRWGGSYVEMTAFTKTCPAAINPRCAMLEGYPDFDLAMLAGNDDLPGARKAIDRALSYGENWEFLEKRARIRMDKDTAGALEDINRALVLRPGFARGIVLRAWVLWDLKRWEDSAATLLDGLRINPTDTDAKTVAPQIVNNVEYDGWQDHKAGHREDALRKLDLAAELAPSNREILSRRAWVILGSEHPDIPALEAGVAKSPDDLRLLQQLDYSLAREGKFPRVVELWTDFIARHPDEGRAYVERGGAYHQMGKEPEAQEDVKRGCELGINEACRYVKN